MKEERLPSNDMTERESNQPRADLSETSRLSKSGAVAMPGEKGGDTAKLESQGSTGPVSPATGEFIAEGAKGGTNVDTVVGRLVIDQGLATPEEVEQCLAQVKALAEEKNQRSLAELLVDNGYATTRQIARLKDQIAAERNQKIPGYQILGKLGAGAMAVVYKARQVSLNRMVAIKVLPRKFTNNPQFIERFYAEGRAAAQLNHPNIVQAYDVGKAGDFHYFVMEYVEGKTVYDEIVNKKRFTEAEALDIVIQTAEALGHAHARGIIHRDVKPKNIMLTSNGIAKLADMGLARAVSDKEAAEAEQGKAFGTPYYISPEQIRGEKVVGPPADIYSLGATLYHMLTGSVPFDGKNPSAVMHKHLKAELVPPDHVNAKLSAGISEVIEMMMAKEAGARYKNCADLLIDLRAVKEKKSPPIAHKGFGTSDLANLAKAEQAAVGDVAVHKEAEQASLLNWLVVLLGVLLVISMAFNIFLASR